MHLISVGINTVESDMQNNGDKTEKESAQWRTEEDREFNVRL